MLKWNFDDFNIDEIVLESKILDYPILFNTYRIFGTVDKEHDVTIGYMTETYPFFNQKRDRLSVFLGINNITHDFKLNGDYKWKQKHVFGIGLNEKIRNNIKLSAAVIKTIIGVSEGHIPLTLKQYGTKFI
jgi:hypothetical protein